MTTTKKLLVLLALSLGACRADNRSSIVVLGRAAPSSDTDCTYAPGGEFQLGAGTLDVGPAYAQFLRYQLAVYVDNQLSDPTDASSATLASSKAWRPDAAKVRVNPSNYVKDTRLSPGLLALSAENTIPMDGQVIQVGGSSVQVVDAISHELGLAIQGAATAGTVQRMVLGISLQGHTLDGNFLETAEWYYPVDVCVGCLPVPACAGVLAFTCGGPGQDAPPVCAAPTAP